MIEIINKEMCMGCYACKNICPQDCIAMEKDREGFEYPKADKKKCINCGLCEKVCPMLHEVKLHDIPVAYAAYNNNEKIRRESSSGGIFTLIAEKIIDENGVVFGARFDENFNVIHDYVESKEELFKFRGSKYVQSRIGDTYRRAEEFLKNHKKVLFTGTPCQIAGLKFYLGKEYEKLICQDIICHGVPSPDVWEKYKKYQEKDAGSKISKISFRNKDNGWEQFSLKILYDDNSEYSDTIGNDIYLTGFNKNLFLRPSCYSCNFKTEQRQSDITLADFWGIQYVVPELNDDKGTSLLFTHSNKGKMILNKTKDKLILTKVKNEDAIKYNPAMVESMKIHPHREEFFENMNDEKFHILIKKYCKDKLIIRVKRKIKRVVKKITYIKESNSMN